MLPGSKTAVEATKAPKGTGKDLSSRKKVPASPTHSSDAAKRTSADLLLQQYKLSLPPENFDEARNRYHHNVQCVVNLIKKGAEPKHKHKAATSKIDGELDQVWRNTCQWLLDCKSTLYVLSPTDNQDAASRLESAGYDPALYSAYFGEDWEVPLSRTSSVAKATVQSYGTVQIFRKDQKAHAHQGSGRIGIIDPKTRTDDELKEMLMHEIQHVAERSPHAFFSLPSPATEYQHEFTARWVSGAEKDYSDQKGSIRPFMGYALGPDANQFDNARQHQIFHDIYTSAYDSGSPAWNSLYLNSPLISWMGRETHQDFVLKLTGPRGNNLVNSPRIDDLYLALAADPPDTKIGREKLGALSVSDKEAILSPGMIGQWRKLLEKLPAAERDWFVERLLSSPAGPP